MKPPLTAVHSPPRMNADQHSTASNHAATVVMALPDVEVSRPLSMTRAPSGRSACLKFQASERLPAGSPDAPADEQGRTINRENREHREHRTHRPERAADRGKSGVR